MFNDHDEFQVLACSKKFDRSIHTDGGHKRRVVTKSDTSRHCCVVVKYTQLLPQLTQIHSEKQAYNSNKIRQSIF